MSDEELAKDLGLLAALTIGVGTMIGAGIFVLPGPAAEVAGPIVALSFVIGGGISLFTAMSASELGTAMPKAGGSYYYVNHALGPLFGTVAGMGNWMGLAFASAFYALGFGSYLDVFFPLPRIYLLSPGQVGALLAGAFFVGVNYVGAKETGRVQNFIVISLVGILTVFVGASLLEADPSKLMDFAPRGYDAVLPATALIFVSFLGFVKITTVAEELKNPDRNLPIAVIGSVVIVTVIYALVMVTMMAVLEWDVIAQTDTAVVDVARVVLGPVGASVLVFAGLLATASSANASILASSRINFAMGRDKLVSNWLNEIHERYSTPHRSISFTGFLILLFITLGDVESLAKAGSVLHLIVYGLLNVALIVMRESNAPYEPSYTVPFYPIVPLLGAVTSFGLIAFMATVEIALSGLFVFGAIVWYFVYAGRHADKEGVLMQMLRRSERIPESVASSSTANPSGQDYRVMVFLSKPETERGMISLASAIAKQRGGMVDAVHIVQVPDQTPLQAGAKHRDEIDAASGMLLESARRDAETFGVPVKTSTIVSHRLYEEMFDAAREHEADLAVVGWLETAHWSPGRAEGVLDELTRSLPCDFLMFKDRGYDTSHILVPTAGGPDSELSVSVAKLLRMEHDSKLTLLNVVPDESLRGEAREFLNAWARDIGIEVESQDVDLVVDVGDVEDVIQERAEDASLLLLGATEEGLLRRLVTGSIVHDVVDKVDCSVVMAEKKRSRSLLAKIFG